MKFSVLIAVYAKEKPAHLMQSLESIFRQDLPPDEVILVEDGPLTAALDKVVAHFKEQHEILHTVKLPQNQGLGLALKEGLTHCQYDIVARMDSDDISKWGHGRMSLPMTRGRLSARAVYLRHMRLC